MEFLQHHQLNIMLIMIGTCSVLSLFVLMSKSLSPKRKHALFLLEAGATFLLVSDRFAYIFRGEESLLGWWMVRICNYLVFSLSLFLIYAFDLYLADLFKNEGGLKSIPKRLQLVKALSMIGEILIVVSQFNGMYYTFDDANRYHRADAQLLSYVFPFLSLILQFSIVVQHRKKIARNIFIPVILFIVVPVVATVLQIFFYGVSLTNMSLVGNAVVLYAFVLIDMNEKVEKANRLEIEFLKEEQAHMQAMFTQTATALARAIDAKDRYTHGHSARVAEYSAEIARRAGKTEKETREIYFAALLHDVGKIGIPDSIINKEGSLTEEEADTIRMHPVIGSEILQSIKQSPYISVGARYHHERYDGRGYPDGLKGENIPEIARIIAVADTYDAMTSKRSYRSTLPQKVVRAEIVRGMGTQFDPVYASIMVAMIDADKGYRMQEQIEDPYEAAMA